MWAAVCPGAYHYQITAQALVLAMMAAFALRLSGLREIVGRLGRTLGTDNFSSLSPALARPCSLAYVQGLIERLPCRRRAADEDNEDMEAIDGMAVTLPATQRHQCAKYNRRTVGGGVIWSFALNARRGLSPVRVLKVIRGAWRDGSRMKGVALEAAGPIYLMDRGFYALELVRDWIADRVRFIVRVRRDAVYQVLEPMGEPRRYGVGRIEVDARVRLGATGAKAHPQARLVRAVVGKQIIMLVSGQMDWSAERLLDAYKKRERIEKFHQCLKDVIGLAHLYSFAQNGLEFLLHVALLLAMLLVLSETKAGLDEDTVAVLRRAIKRLRRRLGLGNPWKRNTYVNQRKSHRDH